MAIRSIRRDAIEKLKEMKKSGISSIEGRPEAGREKTQDLTNKYVKNVDECPAQSEKRDHGHLSPKVEEALAFQSKGWGSGRPFAAARSHRHHHGRQRQMG